MAEKVLEAWEKKGRVHLRGLVGDYDLKDERKRLRELPRVIKSNQIPWKGGPRMFNKMLLQPKDGGIQTVFAHLKELLPGSESQIHGHQNDALMYIIRGRGFDVQDGEKIEWQGGDLAIIRGGTVHQHVCTSDVPARVLIFKPKSLFMFANLIYQELVVAANKDPLPGWEGFTPGDWFKGGHNHE